MKHFSHLLQAETAPYGVTVQVLSPMFIKTNMLKGLGPIHKLNSLWIPDGETYAKHAIKTLGFSGYTSGFWANGLWVSFCIGYCSRLPAVCQFLVFRLQIKLPIRLIIEKRKFNRQDWYMEYDFVEFVSKVTELQEILV